MTFVRDCSVRNEHPSLPDHFPGHPIVPGSVIMDMVRNCLAEWQPQARIHSIVTAKFMTPILPEQSFRIQLTQKGDVVGFQCIVDGEVFVQGKVKLDNVSKL